MNHNRLSHDMKLSLQHIKANSKKVNNELHLAEGIGFRPNNVNNEKLTVLCSQIEQKEPEVLSYPVNIERLTADIYTPETNIHRELLNNKNRLKHYSEL